jgi:hypothetical protein
MRLAFDRRARTVSHLSAPFHVKGDKGFSLFLDGRLYYHRDASGAKIAFTKDAPAELLRLLERSSLEEILDRVEGDYILAVHDGTRDRISFFSDKLRMRDIYYYSDAERVLVGNSLQPFMDSGLALEYDADALLSSLAMCIPRKQTPFREVKRLRYNEILHLYPATGELRVQVVAEGALTISDYGEQDLARYREILETAILSRASDDLNVVQCSGGYDSTLLLAILRHHLGKQRVQASVFQVTMTDGRVLNPYEVEKVLEIGKRLDVDTCVIEVDNRDPVLTELFVESLPDLKAHHLFVVTTNQYRLATTLKARYGNDVTVFNGEGCDSLHNFGFSQFISIPHSNADFAEYADNMKTWLFGPDFFKKVLDGSFAADPVYQLFLSRCPQKTFVDTKGLDREALVSEYLVSFVMSDIRLPFRRLEPLFLRKDYEPHYRNWLKANYFADAARRLDLDNLYYHYSVLYTDFWLQSPEIRRLSASLPEMRLPYLDSNLFSYLAGMPQSFGRGLDFRRNKHPLKELIRNGPYEFPLDVVRRTPHSYLTEVETGALNTDEDYLLKSRLAEHLRDAVDLDRLTDVFSASAFELDELKRFMGAYKRDEVSRLDFGRARAILQGAILCSAKPHARSAYLVPTIPEVCRESRMHERHS